MATTWISTNTELGLINALTQSLTVYLPNDAPQGKTLFVKDAAGNSVRSTITLTTQGADTFEDGSLIQTLNSAYESIQLNYSANKWYITGGTMFNTMSVSTLQAQTIQTSNLSSLNISVSTLQFIHNPTSTVGTFSAVSSLLLYNGFNIGGGVRTAIPQTLNRYRFSPVSLPSLAGWYDAADPLGTGVLPTNGSLLQTWFDKSANKNHATQPNVGSRPTYSSSNIVFNGTNNLLLFTNPSALVANTSFSIFVVEQRGKAIGYNLFFGGGSTLANNNLHCGYSAGATGTLFGFYANDLGNGSGVPAFVPGNEPYRIWDFIFTNPRRNMVINGTSIGTDPNAIPLQSWLGGNIGNLTPSVFWYNGSIREILFYNPALSIGNQQRVEGYLAWKWGLQGNLPASNPFKNAPP